MLPEPGQEMLPEERPLLPACIGLGSRDGRVKPARLLGPPKDSLFPMNFRQGKETLKVDSWDAQKHL